MQIPHQKPFKGQKRIANQIPNIDDECKEKLKDENKFSRLMDYLEKYFRCALEAIENVFCAICRGQEREDFFFYQQDLYRI